MPHVESTFVDEIAMDLEVLELPLRILKVTGLDPRDTSLIAKVKCFMAFISLFVMVVTIVMEMQRKELSITTIVPLIEALMVGMEVHSNLLKSIYTFICFICT